MAVVTATNLRKELSGEPLFDGVSFKVERRDRVSLSGPNGAGKTTLLRLLNGETELHGGTISMAKGTRIALHDQRPPAESTATLRDYVLSGAADLTSAEQELRRLEEAMAQGDHEPATLRRYAETQARLEHAGGYAWRERLDSVTRNLGFATKDLDRPLYSFSGGELTRASLARALGGDPDLLLLDEPTNHLDVASLEWLERELQSIDAAVLLVAHDRWFLEAVTNAVLELEAGRSTYFAGPWHNWRREKSARLAAATTAADRIDVDIARLERFVERFRYKKSLAKRAQAKLTHISRLEKERSELRGEIDLLTRRAKSLGFDFLKPKRTGRTVELRHRARRTRRSRRPERRREDDAPRDAARPTRAEGGQAPPRPRRRARVLLPARGRARREPDRALAHPERDWPPAPAGAEPARPISVHRLGIARATRVRALGR
jgi:ATP-binding cassette subfamily F protein 3